MNRGARLERRLERPTIEVIVRRAAALRHAAEAVKSEIVWEAKISA